MMPERLFDKIFTSLLFRKAYHFAGGTLLFFLVALFDSVGIYVGGIAYLLGFLALGKRISFAVMGMLILFAVTGSKIATLSALIIFTLGDGFAGVVGGTWGRRPLPWNRGKTLLGSAAFLASSVIGMFALVSAAGPIDGWHKWLLVVAPSLAACVLESLPISVIRDRKPDDNLIIILASGLIVFAIVTWLAIPDPFR